jgi:hypothetical protein
MVLVDSKTGKERGKKKRRTLLCVAIDDDPSREVSNEQKDAKAFPSSSSGRSS